MGNSSSSQIAEDQIDVAEQPASDGHEKLQLQLNRLEELVKETANKTNQLWKIEVERKRQREKRAREIEEEESIKKRIKIEETERERIRTAAAEKDSAAPKKKSVTFK